MCASVFPHQHSPTYRGGPTHLQSHALGPELGGQAQSASGTQRWGRKAAPRAVGRGAGGSAGRSSALPGCSAASFLPWQLAQPASQAQHVKM